MFTSIWGELGCRRIEPGRDVTGRCNAAGAPDNPRPALRVCAQLPRGLLRNITVELKVHDVDTVLYETLGDLLAHPLPPPVTTADVPESFSFIAPAPRQAYTTGD